MLVCVDMGDEGILKKNCDEVHSFFQFLSYKMKSDKKNNIEV